MSFFKAFRTGLALAGSYLHYARAMRERLPKVAEVFAAGEIDYRMLQTLVYRTDLITDAAVLARVDAELALRVRGWPSMTRGRLAAAIDRIVAVADPDAVRRVRERARDREVSIWNSGDGMGEVYAQLYATDAQALDARLNALVATVCAGDPRSTDQRRADALGALAAGADRLACRCDNPDCAAEGRPVSAVVIHVVAEQASVKGHGQAPAALLGGDALIPAELVAELAKTAGLQPIPVPGRDRAGLSALGEAGGVCAGPGSDLSGARLRPPGHPVRPGSHHRVRRRWAHPRVQPQMPVPSSSFAGHLLWLARPATARRHGDLDAAG
ncbi:hypothetical protein MSHI_30620 [Mycobacterium shinjukuense]|uniref:DUF222 domain-containing protein n=1 Tax=Mycobacterium shinjukuense TaxID=398694 RepID=A0A7I7MSV7_9MYCO|nr:hypothetical protein MSHI_30620 [Mycobacterium shinjukuense]